MAMTPSNSGQPEDLTSSHGATPPPITVAASAKQNVTADPGNAELSRTQYKTLVRAIMQLKDRVGHEAAIADRLDRMGGELYSRVNFTDDGLFRRLMRTVSLNKLYPSSAPVGREERWRYIESARALIHFSESLSQLSGCAEKLGNDLGGNLAKAATLVQQAAAHFNKMERAAKFLCSMQGNRALSGNYQNQLEMVQRYFTEAGTGFNFEGIRTALTQIGDEITALQFRGELRSIIKSHLETNFGVQIGAADKGEGKGAKERGNIRSLATAESLYANTKKFPGIELVQGAEQEFLNNLTAMPHDPDKGRFSRLASDYRERLMVDQALPGKIWDVLNAKGDAALIGAIERLASFETAVRSVLRPANCSFGKIQLPLEQKIGSVTVNVREGFDRTLMVLSTTRLPVLGAIVEAASFLPRFVGVDPKEILAYGLNPYRHAAVALSFATDEVSTELVQSRIEQLRAEKAHNLFHRRGLFSSVQKLELDSRAFRALVGAEENAQGSIQNRPSVHIHMLKGVELSDETLGSGHQFTMDDAYLLHVRSQNGFYGMGVSARRMRLEFSKLYMRGPGNDLSDAIVDNCSQIDTSGPHAKSENTHSVPSRSPFGQRRMAMDPAFRNYPENLLENPYLVKDYPCLKH